MKSTKLKYLIAPIYIIGIILLIPLGYSCSDMNELADRFLDNGETIYAAKVDSASAGTGNRRILIELYIRTPRIEAVRIYWNNNTDSVDVPINGRMDIFKKTIDGLAEKSYIFNLVSFDKHGNRSLPYEVTGTVYGENYQSTLLNRGVYLIQSDTYGNKFITWGNVDVTFGAKYTEIQYTNQTGKNVTLKVPVEDSRTVIPDYKGGTKFKYRTVYVPDQMGVDTFYTDYKESVSTHFSLIKQGWKIVNFSSQHAGGDNAVTNIIDGTNATRWHCDATPAGPPYPHHVTFDLGGIVTVSQFGVWATTFEQATGNVDLRGPDKIQFLVSRDGNEWTDLGSFDFDRSKLGEQLYPVTPTQARYYKFMGIRGPEKYMVLGELDVYSQ
ncbi:DUF4998 domain-containing protein [Proteiniphilum sp.]|uniref:DUF4998 domain-containing protein n=1 Tax=Proteiniphilum sp. TaxID=1926877 RepID=UPI002B1FE49C|nr:DUF4998 domain-containing protein [Proteiniphilum sp.]MEA4917208.1 DUF4998 domain-containing protein [Proteiniphilum sp.]